MLNEAVTPLNFTIVAAGVMKFDPKIWTVVPTGPLPGENDETVGVAAAAGGAAATRIAATAAIATVVRASLRAWVLLMESLPGVSPCFRRFRSLRP
jgi:hypothetical protein